MCSSSVARRLQVRHRQHVALIGRLRRRRPDPAAATDRLVSRREAERVRDVEVAGDQRTTGLHGSVEDDAIVGAAEVLVVNGVHVVAGVEKVSDPLPAEVLVELEPHATSMKRPLARSEP